MKKIFFVPLLFLTTLAFSYTFFSCEKSSEIVTNTVIETDTLYITQQDTAFIIVTDTLTLTTFLQDTATTFLLVRHAETDGMGSNPNLSAAGQARAEELRRVLANVPLDAVFSTNFNRTMQTAQPTAEDKSLAITAYDPFNLSPFVEATLAGYHAGAVLVVGHSNTTPSLLNVLVGANTYSNLPETEYDNLFVVTVFEKGRAEVVHLKYGR
ncbi:MAG: histidine phosphatase family protein [Lewinellaceae bacterium]|nr:histidine phosphatase family protein [Phaeodactylibacter sp.]MCB9041976.1 histidine phosphatase family protein [Lewinellaceae bacterium]